MWKADESFYAALVAPFQLGKYVHRSGDGKVYNKLKTMLIESYKRIDGKKRNSIANSHTDALFDGWVMAREGYNGYLEAHRNLRTREERMRYFFSIALPAKSRT